MRTVADIEALFDKHSKEFLKFKKVENKLSLKPHLHAMMLLDSLAPGKGDLIVAAARDNIYLNYTMEQLASSTITEEQVLELVRAGVEHEDGRLLLTV